MPQKNRKIIQESNGDRKGSPVGAVFSALASSDAASQDLSPSSSDRGYSSDRGSDTVESVSEAKKILYTSDKYDIEKIESSSGTGKPAQSRSMTLLQQQLE